MKQVGLNERAETGTTPEDRDATGLRKPANPVRAGWAEAARKIAEAGDDELVMSEFGNADDAELAW
jgi:antitoxin MazE